MRKTPNSELARISVDEFKRKQKTPIVIVLDNVRSGLNVGGIFRTSDAFLIEKIYLCGICAPPDHKEVRKSALGATQSVDWERKESTLEVVQALKKQSYKIATIEQTDESIALNKFNFPTQQKLAIVFGHEVDGVSQDVVNISDFCIELPQFGTKHSLNVAVSAGIVIWDLYWKTLNQSDRLD